MRGNLRLVHVAWFATATALASAAACSDDEQGQEPAGNDGGSDVQQPPDGGSPDVTGDQSNPPLDANADAGPKCKTSSCAIAIAAGPFHTCAVLGDHSVKCWGENKFAELGTGTVVGTTVTPKQSTALVAAAGITDAVAIAAGGEPNTTAFTCVILAAGSVRCWGSNNAEQLGPGLDASVSPTGNIVPADASAASIDLGYRHGCMVDTTGLVRCWGSNSYKERGTTALLGAVPLEAGASAVTAGFYSTCALAGGSVVCFGYNANGEVNPSSLLTTSGPNVVDAGAPAVGVSAGTNFTCATLDDAGVSCWGPNIQAQLGRPNAFARNPPGSPAFTPGLAPISITASMYHSCAIMADRGVSCWGSNGRGQSGDFSGRASVTAPNGVGGIGGVAALVLGYEHSCALTENGDVYCWGSNGKGQLGPNTIPVFDGGADGGDAAAFDAGNGTDTVAHPDPIKIPL